MWGWGILLVILDWFVSYLQAVAKIPGEEEERLGKTVKKFKSFNQAYLSLTMLTNDISVIMVSVIIYTSIISAIICTLLPIIPVPNVYQNIIISNGDFVMIIYEYCVHFKLIQPLFSKTQVFKCH